MGKKIYILLFLVIMTLGVWAQDTQRFAQRDIMGTARYVGMGGAMTAIGGDPTAVMDNPAGLGLYRRGEITVSLDRMWDYTISTNSHEQNTNIWSSLPNLSFLWSWGNTDKQRGIIFNNLMVGVQRMATYNRSLSVSQIPANLANTICLKTNGLNETDLQSPTGNMYDLWENTELGWLSILGYNAYLIDPQTDSQNRWEPAMELTTGSLYLQETGTMNQYSLDWAMNINNQLYVGIGLNVPTLSYSKTSKLVETGIRTSVELTNYMTASGTGFNTSVGLIYRPCQWVRMGASFQTPTLMSIKINSQGNMLSDSLSSAIETPWNYSPSTSWILPMRVSAGVALQVKQYGLLSLQYNFTHQPNSKNARKMTDVHSFRIGAEANIAKGLYMNAGYVWEPSFNKQDNKQELSNNDVRTDTDSHFVLSSQYASLGVGYRWARIVLNAAYQYRWQNLNIYATELQDTPSYVTAQTHNIVVTLAWRFN